MHDYQAKRTIDEVYQRVQKLFGDQPDLLDEFKYTPPPLPPQPHHQHHTTTTTTTTTTTITKEHSRDLLPPYSHRYFLPDTAASGKKGKGGVVKSKGRTQAPSKVDMPEGCDRQVRLLDRIKQNTTRSQWTQ